MPDDSGFVPSSGGVASVALAGLLAPRKTLPPKLFYDEEGCRLFYRITEVPEYYLTRTERRLLEQVAPLAAASLPAGAVLVEYGASDEEKAGTLLRSRRFSAYVPIDVATPALQRMRARLAVAYPALMVLPVTADFLQPVALPPLPQGGQRLGFFPGSTIGNLEPADATLFLDRARRALGPGARFLLGVDLRKDATVLIPAYDDAAGVTAAFNLNLLVRLNREAGADFDLDGFRHQAVWNDTEGRIEMHLVSQHAQTVRIGPHTIAFEAGESIHTENSYKYTSAGIAAIAGQGGWRLEALWTDPDAMFALILLRSDQDG